MSPYRILLYLISVLGVLLILSFVVPAEGFDLFGYKVRFPSYDHFMAYRPVEKKDISTITDRLDKKFKKLEADSSKKHKNADLNGVNIGANTGAEEIDESGVVKITFGNGSGQADLYNFFAKLASASANKDKIRIIHYGDSQIEGDRITAYLRSKVQGKFGGFGPGMIPFMNVYPTMSFKQAHSPTWKRYASFPGFVKGVKHKSYGAMCSFARFTPVINDSSWTKNEETEAWVEVNNSKSAYGTAQNYNRVKIFYGNCKAPVSVKVYNGGELIHEDSLKADGATHIFELTFDQTPANLKYVFKGKDSPDFYCFVLDGAYGVGVDNVAMRGASGTFVNANDRTQLKLFYDNLGVELFLMQFGGNTVVGVKDSASARTHAHYIGSQLSTLKRLRPGCAVILVGPSDMSTKIDGDWKTYPLLPAFISYLKQEAYKAGAGYWDIYSAMGGENSMPTWVDKNLAGPDYTHFTPSGAKFVGEMFYEALIFEYNKYLEGKKQSEPE